MDKILKIQELTGIKIRPEQIKELDSECPDCKAKKIFFTDFFLKMLDGKTAKKLRLIFCEKCWMVVQVTKHTGGIPLVCNSCQKHISENNYFYLGKGEIFCSECQGEISNVIGKEFKEAGES